MDEVGGFNWIQIGSVAAALILLIWLAPRAIGSARGRILPFAAIWLGILVVLMLIYTQFGPF